MSSGGGRKSISTLAGAWTMAASGCKHSSGTGGAWPTSHSGSSRRKAARWVKDNLEALRRADPEVPQELHDRACDNWRPLIAIADPKFHAELEEYAIKNKLLTGSRSVVPV